MSRLPWIGPVPGDIAEIEAYCRIFRAVEHLHVALMDNLCNPLMGECNVSYELPFQDKPKIEDKIVSLLGCIVSLVNKAREDVLSGRSSVTNSFRTLNLSPLDDKIPPLTLFRTEMKRCCESLHAALEDYLIVGNDRSAKVWRKFQRLKNVCYDSGYARPDESPSPFLIANWSPVNLSFSREDMASNYDEISFWKGGQVTEESVEWLIDNGFKTIVDLRAENVKDIFYQDLLERLSSVGKIEVIRIPVKVGTAPSMEQVEDFAHLVSNPNRKRVYLHSKEGVWRTSAMVSRWRQYMHRTASQIVTKSSSPIYKLSERHIVDSNVNAHERGFGAVSSLMTNGSNGNKEDTKDSEGGNGSSNDLLIKEVIHNGNGIVKSFNLDVNPMKSQIPPSNIFSKNEVSRFLRSKKVSPLPSNDCRKRMESKLPREHHDLMVLRKDTANNDFVTRHAKFDGLGASHRVENSPSNFLDMSDNKGSYQSGASVSPVLNSYHSGEYSFIKSPNGLNSSSQSLDEVRNSVTGTLERIQKGTTSVLAQNRDLEMIEGNMCASATGVVRVQSRKKAEMFLVRTDGYSCTREKVTESSLAFTHPSTQQQMLMWKSTPRTVLLLKKLGRELMEQAKEVCHTGSL